MGGLIKLQFPQVNDVNFENMSNDDAVRILREIVSKPGWEMVLHLKLVVHIQ